MSLTVHESVQEYYEKAITETSSCCNSGTGDDCCSTNYDAELLQSLPDDITDVSFGCGDPVTIAELNPGETVLDLGSGAGMDCFLAARQVGDEGKVIGVDMTPAMLEKASANRASLGLTNVEFREGYIEKLPVADSSIDVIMSNCVINLSPDKGAVFQEAFRALKPGGRISVSDILAEGDISQALQDDSELWGACVSGAISSSAYTGLMREAGFTDIEVVDKAGSGLLGSVRLISARITATRPA